MVGQKNGTEKMMNDKTELVKEAKNDKASRCCWSTYQKKFRQNGIRRNATQPYMPQGRWNASLYPVAASNTMADNAS